MSDPKPKIAFYWCASCGGCEEAVLDLAEDLRGVVAAVEIVLWPCAMDFKKREVAALADGALAATFLNGAIRTQEQADMARLLRRKTRCLIAYGACAQLGGIPGLANQFSREDILRFVYEQAPTVAAGTRPQLQFQVNGHSLQLPALHHVVRALDQVVAVDYYLPGCPPTPKLTQAAIHALLSGKLPPKGTVLAPDVALCEQCPRKATKPADLALTEFHRPHRVRLDPQKCLLAQGVACLGPATRAGCEAVCINGNMPCTGCFGPTSRVRDQGAKALSALASTLAAKEEPAVARSLEGIPDPLGTFYRYGLPKSLLRRRIDLAAED
jgi:F420-non-reducing hydrogenase small subunit